VGVDDITNLDTTQDHEGTRRGLHQWDWRQKIQEKKATKQKMQGEKKSQHTWPFDKLVCKSTEPPAMTTRTI